MIAATDGPLGMVVYSEQDKIPKDIPQPRGRHEADQCHTFCNSLSTSPYQCKMGKSQKKRAMRRHNPMRVPDSHLPKGLASAASSSSKNEAILPIIQKVRFITTYACDASLTVLCGTRWIAQILQSANGHVLLCPTSYKTILPREDCCKAKMLSVHLSQDCRIVRRKL